MIYAIILYGKSIFHYSAKLILSSQKEDENEMV